MGNISGEDAKKLGYADLKEKALGLLKFIEDNPYQPPYEKFAGDLSGAYSRCINFQYRSLWGAERSTTNKVLRMWMHYE